MNKKEREYMAAVADLGCMICGGPAQVHHVRYGQGMGQRAGNGLCIPLCSAHHLTGGPGVALHAGQKTWEDLYGTELQMLDKTIIEVYSRK